jgi:ketosteroid isomerase-like protein
LSTTIDSQVKLALQASAMAWNRGDLPAYMQAYHRSDSLLFIGSRGPTYGWETTLENYRRSYAGEGKMGVLTFQLIKTEVISEEAVFMSGKWSLRRESDMPEGYFTLLWKNIEGEWKIVYDHSSTATP